MNHFAFHETTSVFCVCPGRITQFKVGQPSHTVKAECKIHKKCCVFKAIAKLPMNSERRIMDWMYAGKRMGNAWDTDSHKQEFSAAKLVFIHWQSLVCCMALL